MATPWKMTRTGYEFCNFDFGCGCSFRGFPNSPDGSCRTLVGVRIRNGSYGDVDLSGVTCAAIIAWSKAIHEGNGKAAFILDASTTDEQAGALAQIFTGQLGGMPWKLLGPTFEVVGHDKPKIAIEGSGVKTTFRAEGIAEGIGDTFKNPVTGENHQAEVYLPNGFIWTRGKCGQGTHKAALGGMEVASEKTNWSLYDFDWSNAQSDRVARMSADP